MNELDRLRADVLEAFEWVEETVGEELTGARQGLLRAARRRLEAGRYHLVVAGEFRRGKSTLLNALVDRVGLFPVDVSVTTAVVATLRWGEKEGAVVYFTDDPADPGRTPEPLEIGLADVAGYVTEQQNPGNAKNVLRIEMTAPVPQLKSGLVLADTPGLGSLNAAHTAATEAFLPSADAILFVTSAEDSLSEPELAFLKKEPVVRCPVLITAVTKIDERPDPGPVIAETRRRIAEDTGRPAEELVVVGVSATRKRSARRTGDEVRLAASGFPELERELWDGLALTCGRAQIEDALDELQKALADAAAPLANQRAAMAGDERLREIERELRDAQERVKRLRSRGSAWRQGLKDDLDVAARPIRDRLNTDFDEVAEEFHRASLTDRARTDPDSLVRDVSAGMVRAVDRANRDLLEKADQIADRYSKETETEITASDVSSGFVAPSSSGRVVPPPRQPGRFATFRSAWAGGLAGAGAGASAGALVGSLLAPGPGTVIGGLVGGTVGQIGGWWAGWRDAKRKQRERAEQEQLQHLRTQVRALIESGRRRAVTDFGHQVTDCGKAMTAMLEERIEADRQSLQRSVRLLSERRDERAAQAVEERLNLFRELSDRLHGLRTRAWRLGR